VREGEDILFPDGTVYRALECARCKFWFTEGSRFPSLQSYYARAYPEDYYATFSGGRDEDPGSNPRIGTMLNQAVGSASGVRVLDVGCGNGGFPNFLRSLGFNAEGLELSASASSYARDHYGLRVFTGPLESLPLGETYDAITMVGTVEHLLNPVRTLARARDHLSAGGLLAFDFPVRSCLESPLAKAHWWGLDLPRHTLHLTRDSAQRLAHTAGFELSNIERVITTWFHYGFVSPPSPRGHDRHSLAGMVYQAAAAALLLSRRSPLSMALCRKL